MSDIENNEQEPIDPIEAELRATCLRVMKKSCAECLFGKNKLVSDERKERILADCEESDGFFICHEASVLGQIVCCRAFFEAYKDKVSSLRIARLYERMREGSIIFVDPNEQEN